MSCKTNFSLQLTLLSLFLIFLTTCKKEEIPLKDYPIKEPPIEDVSTTSDNDLILANTFIVLKSETILRNLILQSIFQLYLYPELSDLQNNQATTRTGCPSSSINSGNTIVTLTYDNCNTTSNINYSGTVTLTIDGTLGVTGTTIDIELSEDFLINNNEQISGFVKLQYDGIANVKYDVTDLELNNNSTSPATEVRLSNIGIITHIELVDINGNDDSSNPLTYLENEILFNPYLTVHCPNANGDDLVTLEVAPVASEIRYNLTCGAPYDGEILLTTTSGDFHSSIDFAYPNAQSAATCDNEINICIPDGMGSLSCEAETM